MNEEPSLASLLFMEFQKFSIMKEYITLFNINFYYFYYFILILT